MKIAFVFAGLMAFAAVPTAAETGEDQAKSETSSDEVAPAPVSHEKKAAEKKICKNVAETGTRTGKRLCMTREQWRKAEQDM